MDDKDRSLCFAFAEKKPDPPPPPPPAIAAEGTDENDEHNCCCACVWVCLSRNMVANSFMRANESILLLSVAPPLPASSKIVDDVDDGDDVDDVDALMMRWSMVGGRAS